MTSLHLYPFDPDDDIRDLSDDELVDALKAASRENLSLRQKIVALQNELERRPPPPPGPDDISF